MCDHQLLLHEPITSAVSVTGPYDRHDDESGASEEPMDACMACFFLGSTFVGDWGYIPFHSVAALQIFALSYGLSRFVLVNDFCSYLNFQRSFVSSILMS